MTERSSEDLKLFDDTEPEEAAFVNYDIATYPSDFTLSVLAEMFNKGDITIPDFQREFVWSIQQSSLLIDSFLAGLPVPPVFFYIDEDNKSLVIDGQQRLLTVVFYFSGFFGPETHNGKRNIFRLQGLNPKSPFFNKQFSELEISSQRKLRNSVLRAINVKQLEPSGESTSVYHIFERLNTGGTPLKPQEIRNCVFRGDFVGQLRALNKDVNWRAIVGKEDIDKHQKDVELILKIFSLSNNNYIKYEKPMKEFLNIAMKLNRFGDTPSVKSFQDKFPKAAKLIVDNLGYKPFHVRGPLNSSILDCIFCIIMDNLERIPKDISDRYLALLKRPEFNTFTQQNTSDAAFVKARFELTKKSLIA